jgi:hypothetical protein
MRHRPLSDLVEALDHHVALLRVYAEQAFDRGEPLFLGEVAAKLRLLVAEHGRRQRPLLLDLLDELSIDIKFKLDLPPVMPDAGNEITLREYMSRDGLGIRTEAGFVMRSNAEFVRDWAQQYGASHEAWEVTEHFLNARHSGVFIGGIDANSRVLGTITRTVLYVAGECMRRLSPELIAEAEASRQGRRNG